jgi:tyrosyl-tRNA synthetase
VTTAAGTKFGKTEAGAVWLDPKLTSPYRFYQFWVNVDDRDVSRFLRFFTLLPREEIKALERDLEAHPERRAAQQALARDVTTREHGEGAEGAAADVSALLFGKRDAGELSAAALEALRDEVPFVEIPVLPAEGIDAVDLFVSAKLAPSKGGARRLLEQGGLSVNGKKLSAEERVVRSESMLVGRHLLLRKGAREYALVRVGSN